MTRTELEYKLQELLALDAESETVEFKKAGTDYSFDKLGKYFSALANEANLAGKAEGWLVFGVDDKTHAIVGTGYRTGTAKLHKLKGDIANKTTNRITFKEIHELQTPQGRVLLFQIPPAPRGLPIAFEGHYFGRDGEEIVPLNIEEIERIRAQAIRDDWSAGICPGAGLDDLDPEAVAKARENYKSKFPDKAAEVDAWDDITFLNKAKLAIKGKLTRTALILLGLPESEHLVSPAEAKIRWVLKDAHGNEKDYQIEGMPFLLAVDKVYAKIRNLKYRYMKNEESLFPDEVQQYEPFVIREALNNCIAHQDYTLGGRINVIEMDDQLIFTNKGSFVAGSVERVVKEDAPEEYYRNRFLANAMFNLKMVDTAGGGIRRMFNFQRLRFFPLPEYKLSSDRVEVTIVGKVLDLDFARTLALNPDLSLDEIILLDKVQKKKKVTEPEAKWLKSRHLIEGRKPNYHLSAPVAGHAGHKADYIKNKAFTDEHYRNLILKYLKTYNQASRKDVEDLLLEMLPAVLTEKQKYIKIKNLLAFLRKKDYITNTGKQQIPSWMLTEKGEDYLKTLENK